VLKESLLLIFTGAIAGIASGVAAAQLLRRVLFSVNPTDPITFFSMFAVLAVVASTACVIPALRATRVDPVIALRCD